jgi:hypothetical protein
VGPFTGEVYLEVKPSASIEEVATQIINLVRRRRKILGFIYYGELVRVNPDETLIQIIKNYHQMLGERYN